MVAAGTGAEAAVHSPSRDASGALRSDARGVVIVEYVVVLLLVSALACSTIVLMGMAISKFYMSQAAWIGIPLP